MLNILKKAFTSVNAELTDDKLALMARFFGILTDYNEKINLTRITSEEDAAYKHFADSLVALPYLKPTDKVCDIGSGGGFPAIPLAIATEADITLVDSTAKKVNYLNDAISILGIQKARAVQSRAEDLGMSDKRENFDVVTARAVAALPTLLEYCLPLVKVGGLFLAYKTDDSEIELSQKALKTLGGRVKKIKTYSLGTFADTRALIVIEKIAPTPKGYPRGQNKPRIKPIQ